MRLLTTALTLALALTACVIGDAQNTTSTSTGSTPGQVGVFGSELVAMQNCDELLEYYQTQALELVGPYGLGGNFEMFAMEDGMVAQASADTAESQAAPVSATGTNIQVAGVDEADIVKTNGDFIYTAADSALHISRLDGGRVWNEGSVSLDFWPQSMFLYEDKIVIGGQYWGGGNSQVTRFLEIDVSDSENPTVIRSLDLDGSYADSRLVDGVLRIAINSGPVGLEWVFPSGDGLRAENNATETNKDVIRKSTLGNWLPYSVLTESGDTTEGDLLQCQGVLVPKEFSGINTLSILTFDLRNGIDTWQSAGVVAQGATMYATADHTYLATQRWMDWWAWDEVTIREEAEGFQTSIHMFETRGTNAPAYLASGTVPGFLLSQFSMDEFDGKLRVASTTAPQGWWWSDESESLVTVLQQEGNELNTVGQVGGLGEGEQIFSVRFMGEIGYVVTFRQTDPLYTIDLSNPTQPTVAGELKILGYSAYLHPLGDGLLLGLGQNADEDGRVEGTQLSLFDVSDVANPTRIDTITMDGGWSQAENDHHAFTYADGLILAPFESWNWNEEDEFSTFDAGVIAARLEGESLNLEDLIRPVGDGPVSEKDWGQDPWRSVPLRTLVIDGVIYTITNGGIAAHEADTLSRISYDPW